MEWKEFEKHSTRRQLLQLVGHLLDAKRAIILADGHCKLINWWSDDAKAIENNIQALFAGIEESIQFAGIVADEIQKDMSDPNAKPPPIRGGYVSNDGPIKLTPFQKQLEREGVNFNTTPTHEKQPSKPKPILKIDITTKGKKKQKYRRSYVRTTPDNPPL